MWTVCHSKHTHVPRDKQLSGDGKHLLAAAHACFSAHMPALMQYANTLEGAQGGTKDRKKGIREWWVFFSQFTQDWCYIRSRCRGCLFKELLINSSRVATFWKPKYPCVGDKSFDGYDQIDRKIIMNSIEDYHKMQEKLRNRQGKKIT